MIKYIRMHKAQASIEYVFVITLIILGFIVFQKYIARGFTGRWKGAGDTFGHGRQYDPNLTIACTYDFAYGTSTWYDRECFDNNGGDCLSVKRTQATCQGVIATCSAACEQVEPLDLPDTCTYCNSDADCVACGKTCTISSFYGAFEGICE